MAKISFSSLKLKLDTSVETISFNDSEIEVLQYLPIEDKQALIMSAIGKSAEGSFYNPIKLLMYYLLNMVYMYTNITFTPKQREDEYKLYDLLSSNGILEAVVSSIDEKELKVLNGLFQKTLEKFEANQNSIYGLIEFLIEQLPKSAEATAKIIKEFDPEKLKEVMEFAKAANGGRPIG